MNARSYALVAVLGPQLLGFAACGSSHAPRDAAPDAVAEAPADTMGEVGSGDAPETVADVAKEAKPPFEAGAMNDADASPADGAHDSGAGTCGGERPTCVRPDGNFGICSPAGACGTCTTNDDCTKAYGGGFQCSPDHECFPLV